VFNSTERHAVFGSNTHAKIAACHGLHKELLRQLRAAVDALGALERQSEEYRISVQNWAAGVNHADL
jgi:hypothetical protein